MSKTKIQSGYSPKPSPKLSKMYNGRRNGKYSYNGGLGKIWTGGWKVTEEQWDNIFKK